MTTHIQSHPHPLDYSKLSKGDVVTVAQMEHIFGFSRESDPVTFQFRTMKFVLEVEQSCEEAGLLFTICQRDGEVRILTDDEAHVYNREAHEQSVRRMIRTLKRLSWVDREKLVGVSKEDHDHLLHVNASQVAAVAMERKKLKMPCPGERAVGSLMNTSQGAS